MASTKTKNILITMMLTMSSVFLIGSILLLSRNAYAQTQPDFNIPDEINNEEIPAEEEEQEEAVEEEVEQEEEQEEAVEEEVEQEEEQEEAVEEEVEESSNTKTYQYTGYDDVHEVVSEAVFLNPYNLSSPIGKIIVEDNQTTRVQSTRFANNNHEILKGNNNNEYTNYLKSRIGIIYTGNNIILAGTGITLSTTNIRNIFAFSNALFTPLSSNTFYINAIKGLGINGPSIKSGVNVHGIVKITNNLGSCNANNKGAISTMKQNNLSCLVGCKNDRGQWTLLDKSEECQKLCYQFRQICELTPSNNTNLEPQNAQCTGFTLGQNMTACSSQSDLLSKYKNIKFIGYFTEHCPVSNETNMVNPCAYSCRSGFTPSDDKKSCICKQTTQACPVIDTQKEKRFDHQLDDENAVQSQSACSQTKLQANECKTTTYYTYKCKAGYKRNTAGTGCEIDGSQHTCTGTAPSGAGVITGSNTPDATTSWSYTDSSTPGACQWTCKDGYVRDGTGCYLDPTILCGAYPWECVAGDPIYTGFNQNTRNFYWRCELGSKRETCPQINCDDIDTGSTLHNEYCAKQDPDPLCGTEKGTCINGGTLSGNINTNNNIHTWTCKKGTQSQSCGCEVLVEGNGRCPNNYELQLNGRCKYMPKYCALKKKEQGGYTRWIHANSYCFGENNPDLGIEEHAWLGSENVIIDDFGLWIRNESYKAQRFNSGKPDEGCISPNELDFYSDRYKNRSCVFKKYDITTSSSKDNGFYLDCDGNDLFADPCPGAKISDWPTCGLIVDDRPDPVSEPKCGDSKNSCSSGNFKSNSNRSTSTSYSWTCTNGQDEVSCKIGIQCSQETSGGEDAGHCIKNEQDNLTFNGGSSCPPKFICECNNSIYGHELGTVWECNNDCCYNQMSMERACEYSENRQACESDGLCRWVVDLSSMIDVSVPKFEYCYKEETGSLKQTTTNSGHSRCGGLACGMTSPTRRP